MEDHMRSRLSRRDLLRAGSIVSLGALSAPIIISSAKSDNRILYVNSYGGDLEAGWKKAFCEPFTKATGVQVKTVNPVSFAKLRAQVQTGTYEWDITCMNESDFSQAEHDG